MSETKKKKEWKTHHYEDNDDVKIIVLLEKVYGKTIGKTESKKH